MKPLLTRLLNKWCGCNCSSEFAAVERHELDRNVSVELILSAKGWFWLDGRAITRGNNFFALFTLREVSHD
jgi:hypothetical protein